MKLTGKVGLVTGAGRGIGKAIALAMAAEGASMALIARTTEEVTAVAEEIRQAGGEAIPLTCDVADGEGVERTVAEVIERLGRLDIAINNAGGNFVRSSIAESSPDAWRAVIDSNLLGAYHVARGVVPPMQQAGGGKIINIGSGMGHTPRGGNSAYNVAKAGMWMLTRCLALEVWEQGIEVNEMIPGPVFTRLTEDYFDPTGKVPPPIAPSERVKTPDDCVPLLMYLATHPPGGPTGQSFSLARRPL